MWPKRDSRPISGTAFFVAPKILLTAGHMVPDHNRKVVARPPGRQKAVLYLKELFYEKPRLETFECELLETGPRNVDISVLRVKGDYQSPNWVQIGQSVLKKGQAVDVIGYPGLYTEEYVGMMRPRELIERSDEESPWTDVERVFSLFPKSTLVISYGVIAEEGDRPLYHLSTVVGMSGSPVILDGCVVGATTLHLRLTHIQGFIKAFIPLVISTSRMNASPFRGQKQLKY